MNLTSDARRLAGDLDFLLACVHCGLCLPECPTYQVLRDENDSPRGRLYLMRAMAEGRLGLSGAAELHLGRCLGCRACETVCPAGVDYTGLLEGARADLRQVNPPRARRTRLALWLLTGAPARSVYALSRLIRRLGISKLLGRLLPGSPGAAFRALSATAPLSRRDTGPSGVSAATVQGEAGATYALARGCVMRGLFGHVQDYSRTALAAWGYRELPLPSSGCCGALHSHAGWPDQARRLARQRIESFETSGARWLASDSAGCGAAMKDYGAWLRDDPVWAERAASFSEKVRDLTELYPAPAADAGASAASTGSCTARVAYDAPCHLLHGQGIEQEPLAALRSMDGLDVEVLQSAATCCGSAGIYSLQSPQLSRDILRPKIQEIRDGDYDAVITGNPGCIMHIGAELRAAGSDVPVLHPAEILSGSWKAERSST